MPVDYGLQGKLIAITGCASGIARGTAEFLASQGCIVAMADYNAVDLQQVADALTKAGHTVVPTVLDVTDEKAVDAWIDGTVAKFGRPLDGAVNLAGVVPKVINIERIEEHNTPDWKWVLDVNLNGTFYCLRAEIRNMARGGSIVNTSSIAGLIGLPMNAAYGASKHAVIGLTRCAAKEVGDREIRVNCVAPGIIDTAMQSAARETRGGDEMTQFSQIKRRGTVEEVARMFAWLLSDDSRFVTGAVHSIDGGWNC
ncbi:enoyl-(Acyl carrier protein) reductase domain-containing protein [Sarocladium implicatum]|nr:enoyl-(Acyl carrier protein) reductase domain-containing protein [Sarocladium implicatum]